MRASHTTKQKKAKCLAYRDGKRCGRVAKAEVNYVFVSGGRAMHFHQSVCKECADRVVAENNGEIVQESRKGFYVQSDGGFSGMVSRRYIKIGE